MSVMTDAEVEKARELAASYAARGYDVVRDPEPHDLPFDLGGYVPDLIVRNGARNYLVEIRSSGTRLSVDRFRDIVDEVKRHSGWGFLLVTADDVAQSDIPASADALPNLAGIRERARAASALARENGEAGFLLFWSALEALLRRTAVRVSLPVERLPTSTLVKHLYTHGELSMNRYERVMEALEVRSHVAFGYESRELQPALRALAELVEELLVEDVGA